MPSSDYQKAAALKHYYKIKADPEKLKARTERRQKWYAENKQSVLEKQRNYKRERKRQAIEYLGGRCKRCQQVYHQAVYEFHHIDPSTKDRDPSKMLSLTWDKLVAELDKCDLLCANCHRITHHYWENK